MFEQLEPRVLLATVTWDGGAGTDSWHDAMNWSGDVLPGASDDVVINITGDNTIEFTTGDVTVNSIDNHEMFDLSGGSLTVAGDWIQRDVLALSGGAIDASLVIQTGLDFSGGALQGDKTTIVAAAYVQITGDVQIETLLASFGVLSWTAGNITLNGGTINSQGLATISANAAVLDGGGTNLVANNGNLTRSGAGTQTIINVEFTSGGDLAVASGNLRFNDAASFLGGNFIVQSGALVRFFGDNTVFGVGATIDVDGVLMFAGGVGHEIRATISDLDELAIINDAEVSLEFAGATIDRLDLDGVFENISQTLTINDRFRFLGGELRGSGMLDVAATAVMIVEGGPAQQILDVEINGEFILKNGSWRLHSVDVDNHGEMFLRTGSIVGVAGAWSWINNEADGVITKHTTGPVAVTGAAVNAVARISNRGEIRTNEGTLIIQRGGTSHAGAVLKAASGATIRIDSMKLDIFSEVVGDGTILVGSTGKAFWHVDIGGVRQVTVNSGGVVSLEGGGGSIRRIELAGLIKEVDQQLIITQRLDSIGGEMNGDGSLLIIDGAVLTIDDGTEQHLDVVNNGTAIAVDGTWRFHEQSLTNNADLFIRGAVIRGSQNASMLVNNGVITKHTVDDGEIGLLFELDNNGEVRVNEGTLTVRRGGVSTGVLKAGAEGTLAFRDRHFTIESGSVVGDGVVTFGAATDGSKWKAGVISVGLFHVFDTFTIEGPGAKTMSADTFQIKGDVTWADGDLTFNPGEVIIRPGGELKLSADDVFTTSGVGAILVEDTGRFVHLGAQNIDFADAALTNQGTFKVRTGGVAFNAGAVQNLNVNNSLLLGTWVVEGGGSLDFGEPVIRNFATTITLRDAGSEFVSLGSMIESTGTIFVNDNAVLAISGDFTNKALMDFNGAGRLTVGGDYVSGAGSITRIDVTDVVDGAIDVTGQAHIGGVIIAAFSEVLEDPPMFIKLVTGAVVFDNVLTTILINEPFGYDVTLNFGNPTKARLKFMPF